MLLIAPLLLAVLGSPVQQDEGDTIQELAPPKNYFQLIDIDGDGTISPPEARSILGLERRPFLRFDTDGDGRVGFGEFSADLPTFLTALGVLPSKETNYVIQSAEGESAATPTSSLFLDYDRDKNGFLDRLELRVLVRDNDLLGLLAKIERIVDLDEDGLVSKDELRSTPIDTWQELAKEQARTEVAVQELPTIPEGRKIPMDPFRRLDVDEDGYLTLTEMMSFRSSRLSEQAALTMLARLDRNKDGRLSLVEVEFAFGR